MPLLNIDIKRVRDRYSSFGNTSKKGDIDEDNRITDEAINALVNYINTYEGQLYQSTKEHEGEYLYIGEDGKITTKIALMDDLPDFVVNGEHIENESLTENHIQPGSLTGAHFEAGTFKDIPIGYLQITREHIAEGAVREINIGEDITNEKLARGSVGETNLQSEIILPEHIADEGIPLRCLPEFGTAYYFQYSNEELEKTIQHFILDNPEDYSVVIENRGWYRWTASNVEELQDTAFINKLPRYVLSIVPNNDPENSLNDTLVNLVRDNSEAEQAGYQLYSISGLLDTTGSTQDDNVVCNYYYDDYFVLPLRNQSFLTEYAKDNVDENGVIDLFNLKVNEVQPTDNENNTINNFSNSGFVKVYISKNTNDNIVM